MNCLSLNIRGIGVCGKSGWVKRLKEQFGISFVALQETMCSDFHSGLMNYFWGGVGFECEFVNAIGQSGGLVSFWDPNVFVKDKVVKDDNFLCVSGRLVDGLIRMNLINIYAPQHNVDKRRLWSRISQVMKVEHGWWVIMGDFNAVRCMEERKNSVFDKVCARDFNEFIDEGGLREYDIRGMKYTFLSSRNGEYKLSRIDRVLVCSNVFNKWPNAWVRALHRELSDHSPLVLSMVDSNFGKKPFRWFDSWVDRPGCLDIVHSILGGNDDSGPADFILTEKLKRLKLGMKVWFNQVKSIEEENEARWRKEKELKR